MSDSDSDTVGVPLIESSASPEPTTSVKRKRDADDKPESKRAAKRKSSKKPTDIADDALDLELGINHAIAHMDCQLLADHVAQRTKRFQTELSLVELEDLRLPSNAILDTTDWTGSRSLDKLADYLETYASKQKGSGKKVKLEEASKEKGSPHTLVIAGAGLRAADLTRALRRFQTKQAKVEKLFAKHIKLKEAIQTVKQGRINVGVGTPQRIIDLLDDGALSSKALERIVVDASHIDQKKRGISDMKETQAPLVRLLARKDFQDRYTEGKIRLLFY